ncbi:MAG: type IX secretion system membrane protein PorP/SprF [Taibaiella sp.]|nr:type IX secretion system membrane protein PorP/SprF [Taibaiella sp.]
MKRIYCLLSIIVSFSLQTSAQSDQHYTMFMYNKLVYNPGYTGSRDVTSFNATLRRQWVGIHGAPIADNISFDAPVGTYMNPTRPHAVGLSLGRQSTAGERYIDMRAYYAYRLQLKKSVLSLGLSAGGSLYGSYRGVYQYFSASDPAFASEIDIFLPNAGAGAYWSSDKFYCGLSVPSLMQNYYDKDQGRKTSKQIRAYYLSGGYVFNVSEELTVQPQFIARYAFNGRYSLPFNADINLSATAYQRLMVGLTYRTSGGIMGIVHVQISRRLNMGYAYDYMISALNGYSGGTHEMVLGYDIVRDNFKFLTPRFIRKF